MKKRRLRFNDPPNFLKPSSALNDIISLESLLDFARRYFERRGDKKSIVRAREIKKLLCIISQLVSDAVIALVPDEINVKYWNLLISRFHLSVD